MAELIFPTGFDEKTTIAQDDMILMADSEDSNKIKKAKYSNLKGEKGDPGQDGQDGQDGTDGQDGQDGTDGASIVSGAFVGDDLVFGKDDGTNVTIENAKTTLQGPEGEEGPEGPTGPAGNGIASITSSKSGKITTVTITETNGDSESFTVSDGADGQGSGDVIGPNSSTDGHLVVFDGVDGKHIKDGGAIGTAATKNTGTSAGNVPVLDSNGKLATSTLPGVALTDTYTVSTSADLTTLSSADQGDIAIVTSENKTYVLSVAPYSVAANWKEILVPTGGVTSVNGNTGAVTVETPDTKVFNILLGLTEAQAAYDRVQAGKKAILDDTEDLYVLFFSGEPMGWKATGMHINNKGDTLTRRTITFNISGDTVTSITQGTEDTTVTGGIQNDTTGTTTTVTKIRDGTENEFALITPTSGIEYHIYPN